MSQTETTLADLAARVEEQDAMIAELQEKVAALESATPASSTPDVYLYREVTGPRVISEPIDFADMACAQGLSFAYADAEWWGPSKYV